MSREPYVRVRYVLRGNNRTLLPQRQRCPLVCFLTNNIPELTSLTRQEVVIYSAFSYISSNQSETAQNLSIVYFKLTLQCAEFEFTMLNVTK